MGCCAGRAKIGGGGGGSGGLRGVLTANPIGPMGLPNCSFPARKHDDCSLLDHRVLRLQLEQPGCKVGGSS